MSSFFSTYMAEIISTVVLILVFLVVNYILNILIVKLGATNNINARRTQLISRYISFLLLLIAGLIESFILGAQLEDIGIVFSSVFAIIGISLFAIWSILSNITSGVIMFFSFPYKVGDKIEIHDKDLPIRAIIEDIRAFHLHLRTDDGDLITYPNNLMLQKAVSLIEKDAMEEGSDIL